MKTVRPAIFFLLVATLFSGTVSAQNAAGDEKDKTAVGAVGPIKLSGLMFGDFYYYMDAMDADNKDLNGLQFRRIYITTDYTINSSFSTRFRLEADESALSSNGKISVFVKDAYLKWKNVFSGSDLVFGISPTPAISAADDAWGYRAVEKTLQDFLKISSSRDVGIDLKGKFNDAGTVRYWLKLGNNTGNSPETNKFKRYYALVQVRPTPEFSVSLSADYASHPQVSDSIVGGSVDNGALVAGGLINYQVKNKYSIGVEGFYKSQSNNYYDMMGEGRTAQAGLGLSAFAWYAFTEDLRILGRYDNYDPNTDSDAMTDVRSLIIAALDFKAADNINFMPGVEVISREGMDDSDVIPRVTFLWKF